MSVSAIITLHCAVTWALAGLIWTVQLALYPLFGRTGRESFPDYHAVHMRRITIVVAPLMLVEIATAAWLLLFEGERGFWFLASLPLLLISWASTALVQVPLHKKLERVGFEEATCRKLTRSNWLRTAAWTSRAVFLGLWLLG